MLTSVVLSSTLANVALGAAVPDKFVRRQEDGDSSSSSMMDSSIASSSMMPSSASSIMDSMSGSSTASSAAPTASSSQSYAEGLVSALDSVGLSTLASLVEPLGDDFIGMLDSDQNMTIFTPTNEALSNVNINTSDTEAVREVLSYHILPVRSISAPRFSFSG